MTIVVVDTNVLASGIVGFADPNRAPALVLRTWQARAFTLAISDHILSELLRTLQKPYFMRRLTNEQIAAAELLLRRDALQVAVTATVFGIATHPEDDIVLATAVGAKARYLITGDTKLQDLGLYQDVTICSARAFLTLLAAEQQPTQPDLEENKSP